MNDFLGKYYPGIKRVLHKRRILVLIELLEREKEIYEKNYHEEIN